MSYIICFWDKSKIQVPDEVAEKLKTGILNHTLKSFDIGPNFYTVGGVEKIITKDEAFNVFPTEWEQLTNLEDRLPTKETMLALEAANQNPAGIKKLDEIKKLNGLK